MNKYNGIYLKEKLIEFIQDWFRANGENCNAIIGISGGKDSTVAAALCAEALGKDRVIGVLMPNGEQSDIKDSHKVVNHLGIRHITANIENAYNAVIESIDDVGEISNQTKINIAPRLRMTTLYAVAQSVNGRVINTSNLSEKYIGYFTRWGDGVGDVSLFGNLTCEDVIAIGDSLDLPCELVHKAPADGLTGKSDEDRFGFTYKDIANRIYGINKDDEAWDKIDAMSTRNFFKSYLPVTFDPTY